ncbi:MAG: 4-(cytidine 5'-diphospho)-2-C-methyl-D-erythritol kinase [Bacteroidaceae bacterium]|nr:4-(cytidine 5'-diphospho)-2-C-methyl-D-erythritol kinase [Bacteroidaceae bacterium]
MITFPNCKINLGLNIVNRRPDGYHNLETVFYPVTELYDALEITPFDDDSKGNYTLQQNGNTLDCDKEHNLVIKAYRLLLAACGSLPSIHIHLLKHIPSGAGLGGGSADAAFMLKILNDQFKLQLTTQQLEHYAAQLGADCAFFIKNQPTFATGIGEIFTPINLSLKDYQIIIIKPNVFVSTKEAFAHIHPQRPAEQITDILQAPISEWRHRLVNDFEASIFPQHPQIESIKNMLYEKGAEYASMSGSGSSVFGLFNPNVNLPKLSVSEDCFCFAGRLC